MRSALPSRQSATTSIKPPGASSVRRVCGSCIGRMPLSSRTVATQMEFDPDIGGVSSGSMMMKPICARGFFGGHEQIDMPEDAAARFIEHKIPQRAVPGDEPRLLP